MHSQKLGAVDFSFGCTDKVVFTNIKRQLVHFSNFAISDNSEFIRNSSSLILIPQKTSLYHQLKIVHSKTFD